LRIDLELLWEFNLRHTIARVILQTILSPLWRLKLEEGLFTMAAIIPLVEEIIGVDRNA
jgi:hypothetical protein